MHIDRFTEVIRLAATKFNYWYNRMHEKQPDEYPLNLDEEDWDENFSVWQDLGCPETPEETEEDSDECE